MRKSSRLWRTLRGRCSRPCSWRLRTGARRVRRRRGERVERDPRCGHGNTIVGAGASFPYPLYSTWGSEYNNLNGVKLNYQSIGSGGGISAIQAKTVDFGASDAPLEPAELQAAGLMQWPQCVGGVVLVVNLEASRPTSSSSPAGSSPRSTTATSRTGATRPSRSVNPGVDDPRRQDQRRPPLGQLRARLDLHPVPRRRSRRRLDAAAATRRSPGRPVSAARATRASPPACSSSRARSATSSTPTRRRPGCVTTQLQNADGEWVEPSLDAFGEAAAQADWAGADGLLPRARRSAGPATWPITGASFIMVQKRAAGRRSRADAAPVLRLGVPGGRRDGRKVSTTCRSRRTSTS